MIQERETGVSLEMYLVPFQLQIGLKEAHPVPGLCDTCLPDIFQVLEYESHRLHWWFTRNEYHFRMIRRDSVAA